MSKYYIGGVASVSAFVPNANDELQHLFDAKTLTDSSINVSVSNEEIRGGEGAQLLGKFFHTTVFNLSLTDALFDLNYIAMQVGGNKKSNQAAPIMQTYTLNVSNQIIVPNGVAALTFGSQYDEGGSVIAWGEGADGKMHTYTLTETGKDTHIYTVGGFNTTTKPKCVTVATAQYGEQVQVNAMYTPGVMSLVMRAKLFLGDSCKASDGKAVGQIVIEVPKFQLDGTIDLAMAMTSPATYALNGSALAVGCGCDDETYYAKITEVIFEDSLDPFYGYTGIIIDNNYLTQGDTIGVYAFATGKSPRALTTSQYTVSPSTSVVGGVINATATGEFTVTANVTYQVWNAASSSMETKNSDIYDKTDTATIIPKA